jgi:uncharacterized protein YndB with AHSA1/START domain
MTDGTTASAQVECLDPDGDSGRGHGLRPRGAMINPGVVAVALVGLLFTASADAGRERAIEKETVVDATLDQAWEAWTTREGITSFFAPDARIEPRAGGAFHVYIDPTAEPGLKGADEMRFMALQPKRMLSFDWNAPPSLPEVRQQRTFVVVRFEPIDERRTRVLLHHVGWGEGGEWDKAYAYFDRAWGHVLANLKQRFETGPKDWTEWLRQLRAWREQAVPKK